jgi:Ca2+-binding EF-hand superfamily protein
LVDYFDANGDRVLTYNEFSQILLPCEDNVLRNVTLDRSHKAIDKLDILPGDIAEGITSVFEKEIDFSKRLEELKRELQACGFSALHSYRCIDRQQSGVVDTVNLGAFLGSHGKNLDDMHLLAIIRRVDTNGDATIDLNEWSEFLRCKGGMVAPPMIHPQAHPMPMPMAHNSRPVG